MLNPATFPFIVSLVLKCQGQQRLSVSSLKWTGSGNLSLFRAQIQSDRFIMWYELRALALANHNNYVIHMQTLCRSVR